MAKKTEQNHKNLAEGANPRKVALTILHQVAADGAYSNIALNNRLKQAQLSALDKGLVTELVYGTLRHQGTLDYILGLFLTKPLNKLPLWILLILRMGLYQLRYMDKIPDSAAINESVKLAKKYGKPVLAFSGCVTEDARSCNENGIDAYFPILRSIVTSEEAMEPERAGRNLTDTAEQVMRLLRNIVRNAPEQ